MLATVQPAYKHTRALLPDLDAADKKYYNALSEVSTDEDLRTITDEYNKFLEKMIDALHADTKHVNSKSTLEQVFRAKEGFGTHFGVNPPAVIRDFIRETDNKS